MAERTILIESRCKICFNNGHIKIDTDNSNRVFHLDDFDTIVFSSLEITCSLYLLHMLVSRGKTILFCDKRKFPYSVLLPLYGTQNTYLRLSEQIQWKQEKKDIVWKNIIETKLSMQASALCIKGLTPFSIEEVTIGDKTNVEGRYADKYFKAMFGKNFRRHTNTPTNAALDYGYTIMLSAMTRIIISHGYNSTLGVHHIGGTNNYNFACDLIEPFRPMIDLTVKRNEKNENLDNIYKQELIKCLYEPMEYKNKINTLKNTMELFFLDVITSMKTENMNIGILKFA